MRPVFARIKFQGDIFCSSYLMFFYFVSYYFSMSGDDILLFCDLLLRFANVIPLSHRKRKRDCSNCKRKKEIGKKEIKEADNN